MDTTTELDMIEAIRYEYSWDTPLQHLPPIVANTKNLRWIIWDGKSANHLPSSLIQSKLCCLILRYSPQKQLWECDKQLQNLKIMEFRGLKNLITTPDFGGLPNLEKFTLTECWKLHAPGKC
ncbi:hypothetical protein L1887_15411 [Cichorium endivia]|nr:hypothetical protein L1887_15411 [Cichorium endivia]